MLERLTELYVRAAQTRGDDEGATAVEYGLMVALIAVAIMVTVGLLGTELDRLFAKVKDALAAIP